MPIAEECGQAESAGTHTQLPGLGGGRQDSLVVSTSIVQLCIYSNKLACCV